MKVAAVSRFVLGTVQLGMHYGIRNSSGQPSEAEGVELLRAAFMQGVQQIDTADSYGTSDLTINKALSHGTEFKIHTKFMFHEAEFDLEQSLDRSLKRLGVARLESYSFHRFEDFLRARDCWGDEGECIQRIKSRSQIQKMGVSVYSEAEALDALSCPWVDQIQMPLNLLDHGKHRFATLEAIRKTGKTLHVRSVFLQGLFYSPLDQLEKYFLPLRPVLERLHEIAGAEKLTLPQMAILYPLSLPEVSAIVVGVETREQLDLNLLWLKTLPNLREDVIREIQSLKVSDPTLLSPANWPKK